MAKILSIVETAYRATLEEQDDTIVWLNTMFKKLNADISLLFRSNAVNYVIQGQNASGLSIGGMVQQNPPQIGRDITDLLAMGVPIYVVEADLRERGIKREEMMPGVQTMGVEEFYHRLADFDHIWHW